MNRRNFFRNTGMAAGGILLSDQLLKACLSASDPSRIAQSFNYPNYNFGEIYFSTAGSYFTIAPRQGSKTGRLQFRTCRRTAVSQKDAKYWAHDYYELALTKNGNEITFETSALPWGLEIKADNVKGRIAFVDHLTILIEISGADINLVPMQPFGWKYFTEEGNFNLLFHPAQCIHQIRSSSQKKIILQKNLLSPNPDIPNVILAGGNAVNAIAIRESRAEEKWNEAIPSMDEVWKNRKAEVDNWMSRMPEVDKEFINGAQLSWFILWNCQVDALGKYTRPAILMSKNWMNQVWSWDNCFNAMAVASADPVLAWNQLMIMFDNQLPNGILPDAINDLDINTGFVKPPVYGWTIQKLIESIGLEPCKPYLQEIYPLLVKQTEWWFNFRDQNKNGLCAYLHGNDSGWDNSTAFDQGYPTEGADLTAHLILQTEALADFAEILGKGSNEINMWKVLSQKEMKLLLEKCVSDGRFISPLEEKGTAEPSSSLLNYIPTVLGSRLPKDILSNLVKDLSPGGPFMTEYGLATEPPKSPKFQPDGYWRGPIWAPSTYLIFDGLANAGETDLAKEIAVRFCRMCEKDPAMWENYNAVSGKGLRAPAYTWTAAVFILLANWLSYQTK
jgi:putative isomerase